MFCMGVVNINFMSIDQLFDDHYWVKSLLELLFIGNDDEISDKFEDDSSEENVAYFGVNYKT